MDKKDILLREIAKIWDIQKTNFPPNNLGTEIALFKNAMDLCHIFPYYYFINDHQKNHIEFVSPEIKDILGYDLDQITIEFLIAQIHPDDKEHYINFSEQSEQLLTSRDINKQLNYKISYDFRIKKIDNTYLRILQQSFTIAYSKQENKFRSLNLHTDITQLKYTGEPRLEILGLNDQTSSLTVFGNEKTYEKALSPISKREQEILLLLANGKTTNEISKELFIAQETVNKHRKNMLQKTDATNTASLIFTAIKRGWI